MTGEVERKIDFEERKACFKRSVDNFFKNIYKNPNGCEDKIEVCLIRDGYRTILCAEAEINRQKAEIERLKKEQVKEIHIDKDFYEECKQEMKQATSEAISEFNARLYAYKTGIFIKGEELMIIPMSDYDEILKEMVGD